MGKDIHVVTGAFGFSGKYITERLLDAGHEVRTLTNSLHRENPFGGRVEALPFNFDNPERLAESLAGASVLYNTYWVRFNYPGFSYSAAVANTRRLFDAVKKAGVGRIVHISIVNASEDSPFEYFRDKAILERYLENSGISFVILRPAVLFGKEDVLINNIAYFLRHFPVFQIFGDGSYKVQPIHVDDLAKLAVEEGQKSGKPIIDAVGPETFTYKELVRTIGRNLGQERPLVSVSPEAGYASSLLIGKLLGDVIVTRDEIRGLMANLLYTDSAPTGTTKLTDYLKENASTIGLKYASELARRKNRMKAYEKL